MRGFSGLTQDICLSHLSWQQVNKKMEDVATLGKKNSDMAEAVFPPDGATY